MKCKYHDQFDEECIWCARQRRYEKVKNGSPQPFYVIVYGITQIYGGPEEGGWWYDWWRVIEIRKVWTIAKAKKAIEEFQEEYPQPRYRRSSVLGGEDIIIKLDPTLDFIRETTERKRYE